MNEVHGFLGSATVGTKGQIVIPADARSAMHVGEGDKVVILRGPREGSILVFRVDSFDAFMTKAGVAADPMEPAQPPGGDDMDDSTTASAWIESKLAGLPEKQRAALQSLRETIAAAAPEAVDTISYAMPAFRYHGRALVSYDAFKAHCSLFPMGSEIIERNADKFAAFSTSKGTLHFTPEHPIPKDLVELIVRERMAAIDDRRGSKRR
jgi:AbrB family looped-hinge helix DNA binding protein